MSVYVNVVEAFSLVNVQANSDGDKVLFVGPFTAEMGVNFVKVDIMVEDDSSQSKISFGLIVNGSDTSSIFIPIFPFVDSSDEGPEDAFGVVEMKDDGEPGGKPGGESGGEQREDGQENT